MPVRHTPTAIVSTIVVATVLQGRPCACVARMDDDNLSMDDLVRQIRAELQSDPASGRQVAPRPHPEAPPKPPAEPPSPAPAFTPVPVRRRRDGWTPAKQVDFIEALAECACVTEACARVGMSVASAYALQRRPEACSFRRAWECALDHAVSRLSDAVFARAIHGVATPVFYKGEQIGERRRYDERLAMFLLRYRDPRRYGAWRDKVPDVPNREAPAATLGIATLRVRFDAEADAHGVSRPRYDHPVPGFGQPWNGYDGS